MSRSRSHVVVLLAVLVFYPVAHARQQPQPPVPAADLVPVDVHVIDRTGKPVSDLAQSEFTVLEDGVPQRIQSCTPELLAPGAVSPDAKPAPQTAISTSAQSHRIFVFALGMGRLEGPWQGISHLIEFAKTQLLPQDQVAIFAYNRALPFTGDRPRVLAALERIRKSHEDVDFELQQHLGPTGMAPLYGSRVISKKLQKRIDELILGPGAPPADPVVVDEIDQQAFTGMSLDTFMASTATSLQDVDNLMALMEYLRRLDGEKHVLFVTEQGLLWPSEGNDRAIAVLASDARASVHTLRTGGVLETTGGRELNTTMQQAQSLQSLRRISSLTGGLSSVAESGEAILDRLDATTRKGYLLQYQSSRPSWDATFRTIEVKVSRPDVTVLHRLGYVRQPEAGAFDRRMFITNSRLGAAAVFRREVNDIKVKASASLRGRDTLEVKGTIDLSKVRLSTVDGARVGLLNLAVMGLDTAGNQMGMHAETLPLKLTEAEYARAVKGFPYTVEFPAIQGAPNVRFIVYDFGSDLVGRVDIRLN